MKSILKNPVNLSIMLTMILTIAFSLSACGGGGSSPEEVAEKYVKALFNDDFGTQKKFASEKELKDVEKRQKEAGTGGDQDVPKEKKELMEKFKAMVPKAEQANISEDGNTARVKVEMLDKDGKSEMTWKVDLVKEKDEWKVNKLGK
jgi:hypothetical protein